MIAFASFFTIDKAPKCGARLALFEAPYFGNVPLIGLYPTKNFPSITIPKDNLGTLIGYHVTSYKP
jgi:hypothetical protein